MPSWYRFGIGIPKSRYPINIFSSGCLTISDICFSWLHKSQTYESSVPTPLLI